MPQYQTEAHLQTFVNVIHSTKYCVRRQQIRRSLGKIEQPNERTRTDTHSDRTVINEEQYVIVYQNLANMRRAEATVKKSLKRTKTHSMTLYLKANKSKYSIKYCFIFYSTVQNVNLTLWAILQINLNASFSNMCMA